MSYDIDIHDALLFMCIHCYFSGSVLV